MQVLKGKQEIAPKAMLYGLSGSGKSTLASTLPNVLFFDIEGGLSFLDIPRVPITTADELMGDLLELYKTPKQEYKYIVIDSVDWLIRLFVSKVSGSGQGKTLEQLMESATLTLNKAQGGYGNGRLCLENFVRDVFIKFCNMLNRKGYGIILIAHAERKVLLDADGTSTERLAPKMDLNSMTSLCEWCDSILYLKNIDGERTLTLEGDDVILAKNRLGMTGEVKVADIDLHTLLTTGAQNAGNVTKE